MMEMGLFYIFRNTKAKPKTQGHTRFKLLCHDCQKEGNVLSFPQIFLRSSEKNANQTQKQQTLNFPPELDELTKI